MLLAREAAPASSPIHSRRTRAPMPDTIRKPQPLDQRSTRTALCYSQLELALLSLKAQAIAYRIRTGHWPKLIEHDAEGGMVVWL